MSLALSIPSSVYAIVCATVYVIVYDTVYAIIYVKPATEKL